MKKSTALLLLVMLLLAASSVHAAEQVDVVVIGAGGGGLAAAVSAAENGASVVVVEKMPFIGGNTMLSTGAFYAGSSLLHAGLDAAIPAGNIAQTLLRSADGTANESLVRFLAAESGNTINWLETMGVEFLSMTGIALANNGGAGVVLPLAAAAEQRGVRTLLETQATSLIMDSGRVVGIVVEDGQGQISEIHAKAVVIATGGFAANRDMVREHKPDFADLPITCHVGAVGDGIVMAQEVGAALVDLDKVMPVPTADAETGRVITAMMRGAAGASILVNEAGQRFSDETTLYEPLTYIVLDELDQQELPYVFQMFDHTAVQNVPIASVYVDSGVAVQADTVSELAVLLGIDQAALEETVEQYNAAIAAGDEDEFGRTTALRALEEAPFYAMKVMPGLLATRGGLVFNQQAQVLSTEGTAIPGLYAAGETTGGIFGSGYQGGAFLTVALTFGRIAGTQAAITALTNP